MSAVIRIGIIIWITILWFTGAVSCAQEPAHMALVPGGTYLPLYSPDSGAGLVQVPSFYMDIYPVTNADFQRFVAKFPQWRKDQVKGTFADARYLKHWQYPGRMGKDSALLQDRPVVNISWFVAKKYCECQGKRLPTVDEWEYAALASATKKNASKDSGFYQKILDWYGKPTPAVLPKVGKGFHNVYGIYDLHGLVWEWNLDFISALSTRDSRDGNNLDKNEFCGAGANGSRTPGNYAAFMRYAMRASLKAAYCQPNVGFRCVKDKLIKP